MWLLHVVVIPGEAGWQQGVALWLLVAAIGGTFAWLSGEWSRPDGLLVDLALAAVGATLANVVARRLGPDPLALIFSLKLFWAGLGALLLLMLVHDSVRAISIPMAIDGRGRPPITDRGGFGFLFAWLSGWPFEAGIVEATYGDGLEVKAMPETLHYQVRVGPLRGARTIPLLSGLSARLEDSALVIEPEDGSAAAAVVPRPVRLERVAPAGGARALQRFIATRAGADGDEPAG